MLYMLKKGKLEKVLSYKRKRKQPAQTEEEILRLCALVRDLDNRTEAGPWQVQPVKTGSGHELIRPDGGTVFLGVATYEECRFMAEARRLLPLFAQELERRLAKPASRRA
jgi:hypothetical protein